MHQTLRSENAPTPESTIELVRRSQTGDTAAYEGLYRSHVGRIYGYCLRMAGDPVRARELTQDVFVKAWLNIASFRGDAAFATWLHRLAMNVVREHQRGEAATRHRAGSTEELERHAIPAAASDAEERITLERAIATLPPKARNALVLHDIQGFRCREIADLTGSAIGTIQAHLHRARMLLKEAIGK